LTNLHIKSYIQSMSENCFTTKSMIIDKIAHFFTIFFIDNKPQYLAYILTKKEKPLLYKEIYCNIQEKVDFKNINQSQVNLDFDFFMQFLGKYSILKSDNSYINYTDKAIHFTDSLKLKLKSSKNNYIFYQDSDYNIDFYDIFIKEDKNSYFVLIELSNISIFKIRLKKIIFEISKEEYRDMSKLSKNKKIEFIFTKLGKCFVDSLPFEKVDYDGVFANQFILNQNFHINSKSYREYFDIDSKDDTLLDKIEELNLLLFELKNRAVNLLTEPLNKDLIQNFNLHLKSFTKFLSNDNRFLALKLELDKLTLNIDKNMSLRTLFVDSSVRKYLVSFLDNIYILKDSIFSKDKNYLFYQNENLIKLLKEFNNLFDKSEFVEYKVIPKKFDDFLENLKILYVEDDDFLRAQTKEALQFKFKNIETAKNGQDGFQKYQDGYYDVVITDIKMPKVDGVELCKKIKELNPKQKIIISSAYGDETTLITFIELGINKFVKKPINLKKLFEVITDSAQRIHQETLIEEQSSKVQSINFHLQKKNEELENNNKKLDQLLRILTAKLKTPKKQNKKIKVFKEKKVEALPKSYIEYILDYHLEELQELEGDIDYILSKAIMSKNIDANGVLILSKLFNKYGIIVGNYYFFAKLSESIKKLSKTFIIHTEDTVENFSKFIDYIESFVFVLIKWRTDILEKEAENPNMYDDSIISDIETIVASIENKDDSYANDIEFF